MNDILSSKEKILQELKVITILEDLNKQFPDITTKTNRWGVKKYSSKSVNAVVNKCDFSHSCGCCTDAGLMVYPYIEISSQRIYSDPEVFFPAENAYCGGYSVDYNWQQKFKDENINPIIIEMVEKYLEDHKIYDSDEES